MSDSSISLTALGGGQSIGKSCFLLSVNNQHVLLDCGSYVGKDTRKALPDFSKLPKNVDINDIAVVLISHFHMDHVGGLLYLTETRGYKGDIIASNPTRAVLPLLLHNNRVLLSNQAQSNISVEMFTNLTKRIREVSPRQSIRINSHIRVVAHIAGHVLGAVMWEVLIDGKTILYTGDYSDDEGGFIPPYQLPSRYLLPGNLDMLIMECTYGNTTFKCLNDRRSRLIEVIVNTIKDGGKVLIPCYGIGYTQELIALLQRVWIDYEITAPMYYSSQDTQSTLPIFGMFSVWSTGSLHIKPDKIQLFRSEYADSKEPFILLAAQPNMSSGVARTIFPKLADDKRNTVIFLGNNSPDTYSGQILKENAKIGDGNDNFVECKREVIPFSAHPDRKTNCQLIEKSGPQCVVLVHGDKASCLGFQKYYLEHHDFAPFFMMPENGSTVNYTPEICRKLIPLQDAMIMEWSNKRERDCDDLDVKPTKKRAIDINTEYKYFSMRNSVLINMDKEKWNVIKERIEMACIDGVNAKFDKKNGVRVIWSSDCETVAMSIIDTINSYNN